MRYWIWTASLVLLANISIAQKSSTNCGYPNYCARADTKLEAYPQTPPQLPKAGAIAPDPTFGSRILRVTDGDSDPQKPGQSFQTPASSEQNPWNVDSTRFYVKEAGGRIWFYQFDPSNMTEKVIPNLRFDLAGEPQFSFTKPEIAYGIPTRSAEIQQFDISNGKVTTVNKPSDCLKLDPGDNGSAISVSADDQRFMEVIGPRQDSNYLVYVYDKQKGCRWLNSQTGEIGGQWGPKGSIPNDLRFGIHNARIAKSGKYVAIAGTQEGPLIWDVDSTNTVLCSGKPPMSCGGHRAMGYEHMINPSRLHHPMEILIRPLDDPSKVKILVSNLPPTQGWYDKHISWNNVNSDDAEPACYTNYRTDNSPQPGAALTVKGPWENEVDCIETDGKGSKIWRFAHTYSSAQNGFWSTPRGNVSPDGHFYIFTSDWENTLGKSLQKGNRNDVFIVELK